MSSQASSLEADAVAWPSRVLVVIPAWNEEACVADVVREIKSLDDPFDILVVDDGSLDGTALQAQRAGALVCRLPLNLGVGGAMRTGFRYALEEGYDAVVQVDADGQHDPGRILDLITALKHADVAIGARFAGEGEYKVHGPRRWAMKMLAGVMSRLARGRLTDVTSGFRAANRRAMAIFALHYPAEYLGDTVESLVIALRSGCTVVQVPTALRPRSGGAPSQNTLRSSIYLARAVAALMLALIRRWPAPHHGEEVA